MPNDYVPSRDNDLLPWAKTLSDNIPTDGPKVGLSSAQITAVQDACKAIIDGINANDLAQKAADESNKEKTKTVKTNVKTLRGIIQSAKTNAGYTEAIGENLGIIGSHPVIDPDTYQPGIEAVVFPGHVTIKFTKKGVEGVNIYSRPAGGKTGWQKLSFDSHSPYVDNRPLTDGTTPETREYMAIGVMDDKEIGQMSKVVTAVFGG